MSEVNAGENVTRRWIGVVCGVLLALTRYIPWGYYGGQPLWSWELATGRDWQTWSLRVFVLGSAGLGLLLLLLAIFTRGRWRALSYLLAGGLGVGWYVVATQYSPGPWLGLVPLQNGYAGLDWAGPIAAAVLLVCTAGTVKPEAKVLRAIMALASAVLIALICWRLGTGSAFAAQHGVKHLRLIQSGEALNFLVALTAALLILAGSTLAPAEAAAGMLKLGRRLGFASLAVVFLWGCLEPVIASGEWTAVFTTLNNQLVPALVALVMCEGLSGLLFSARTPAALVFPRRTVWLSGSSGIAFATVALCFALKARAAAPSHKHAPADAAASLATRGEDWPQWCGGLDRNRVSSARNLPTTFDMATSEKTSGLANVKWVVPLGERAMSSPIIADGKVYIGSSYKTGAEEPGVLWCFNAEDGQLVWRMVSPYTSKLYGDSYGICASPTIEGKRAYLVSNQGEVLCLSTAGLGKNNLGFSDEAHLFAWGRERLKSEIAPDGHRLLEVSAGTPAVVGPHDADVIWHFDMLNEARCWPFNALNAGIVVRGDYLYVPTGSTRSGFDDGSAAPIDAWKKQNNKQSYESPALLVLEKKTGKLVATDQAGIFDETFHGAHSTPALGVINGRELLIYGGGNGSVYAFDPDFVPGTDGKPGTLKLVWKFNGLDPESYGSGFKLERLKKAEVIATPVIYNNRVYVSLGNDLAASGNTARLGRLLCIDATQTGDISRTGRIWSFDEIRSSACTVAIADGLLYTGDARGTLYCFDADTGEVNWTHKTKPVWSSPLIADGKVYFGINGDGVYVFQHSKTKKVLAQNMPGAHVASSPSIAHGVLYVATFDHLYALEQGKSGAVVKWDPALAPAAPATTEANAASSK